MGKQSLIIVFPKGLRTISPKEGQEGGWVSASER